LGPLLAPSARDLRALVTADVRRPPGVGSNLAPGRRWVWPGKWPVWSRRRG